MPAKRVLISIDEGLLRRIDEVTRARGFTRSGYLASLAAADLDRATTVSAGARDEPNPSRSPTGDTDL